VPLKPVSATPAASASEPSSKSGTTIVKSAPPKETARITVKPNLPASPVRAGGNFPTATPAGGAVPAVATTAAATAVVGTAVAAKAVAKPVASSKPATTIVKGGAAKVVATPTVRSTAVPVPVMTSAQFHEEGSTTLTTVLAGVLALLTWGTAGVLIASYLALI
jgi:hypothetical protein